MRKALSIFIFATLLSGCVHFNTTIKDPNDDSMAVQKVWVLGTTNVDKAKQSLDVTLPTEGGDAIKVISGNEGDGIQTTSPIAEAAALFSAFAEIYQMLQTPPIPQKPEQNETNLINVQR